MRAQFLLCRTNIRSCTWFKGQRLIKGGGHPASYSHGCASDNGLPLSSGSAFFSIIWLLKIHDELCELHTEALNPPLMNFQ